MRHSPITTRPDASLLLRTLKPTLNEICDHTNCQSLGRPSRSCRMLRMCICGANAQCPACSNHRESSCNCPIYIKGDYCQHCGAQKLTRNWSQSYINDSVILVCAQCHYAFADTVESRWRMRKFEGTNFRQDTPIPELLNPHNKAALRYWRNRYKPYINTSVSR
jgi:hypothetical protein